MTRTAVKKALLMAFMAPAGAEVLPATGTGDVQPDTLLRLRFDSEPLLHEGGTVRIFRAADDALVDVIHAGDEINEIGPSRDGRKRVVRFNPIQVQGATVTIRPHDGRLAYDTAYYVLVEGSLFDGARMDGKSFGGISASASWRFQTRSKRPAGDILRVGDTPQADFRTVQGALNHVMTLPRARPVTIEIGNGRYDDLLYLRGKDNVTLRGESRDGAVIAGSNGNGLNPGAGGSQDASATGVNGGRSVLLIEDADMIRLDRLSLMNTMPRVSKLGGQAEAVHFSSGGRLVVTNANLISEQDTVLVRGYAWFYRSLIAGNVDFIWGYSRATLFEDSEIRSVGDTAGSNKGGYIVQARTMSKEDPGFVFLNSRITHGPGPAGNDVPPRSSYLARPGTRTNWDNVSYINCRIDQHIAPQGWNGQPREGTGWREFNSMDMGGKTLDLSGRTAGQILSAAEAERFSSRAKVFAGVEQGKGWDLSAIVEEFK